MSYNPVLVNRETGEKVLIDGSEIGLGRMRRRIHAWSEVAKEIADNHPTSMIMVTLTYGPDIKWEKNHIRDYLRAVKRALKKEDLLAYAWVAEMQERGVPHYHIYFIVRKNVFIPMPDKSKMWPHGMSQIQKGKSPYYMVSYLKKEYQKRGYIKGMRKFAVWVKANLVQEQEMTTFRRSSLPKWLREELELLGIALISLFPKPKMGGGWILNLPLDRQKMLGYPHNEMEFQSPWAVLR